MPDELEERLKSHARSFDSLLSLIPAKLYYGEDVSDQWKRKKQTTEERSAARRAKLDPDNWKSAKDVLDERERAALKRKREEGDISDDDQDVDPLTSDHNSDDKGSKRQKLEPEPEPTRDENSKVEESGNPTAPLEQEKQRKAKKRAAKRERRQARDAKLREKKEKLKAKKRGNAGDVKMLDTPGQETDQDDGANSVEEGDVLAEAIEIGEVTAQTLGQRNIARDSTASASPEADLTILSPPIHSGTSSISSIQPPASVAEEKPTSSLPVESSHAVEEDRRLVRERFEAKLAQMRVARKADGADGKPIRNRQDLLNERRRKEEERKKAKQEQRRKEKEDERRRQEEEIAKRLSPGGSGSLLSSPRSPAMHVANHFSFGRVAFGDGTEADASLSTLLDPRKQKGPADVQTQLRVAQNKAARLAGYDETKRNDIQEKDMWLNAKKRAHGERVRDDTSLLKKAVKNQESQKRRSENHWTERQEGIAKSQEMRQKKREDNLRKRKEDQGGKGGPPKGKKTKRPGFEGTFRGKTGGGKKKS